MEGLMVEYSKSSRSTCRACKNKITNGLIRVGEETTIYLRTQQQAQGSRHSNIVSKMYFHLDCYDAKNSKKKLNIDAALTEKDQQRVRAKFGLGIMTGDAKKKKKELIANALKSPDEAGKDLVSSGQLKEEFVAKLMPFQKQGVWFALKTGRVLIADEMGLGKTIQGIGFALGLREHWPLLVVTPASVKLSWKHELSKWIPDLFVSDINVVQTMNDLGNFEQAPVTIVPYSVFSAKGGQADALKKVNFKVMILDESHYIKNHTAKRTKCIMPLIKQTKYVCMLSGTPALSKPIELFPQLHGLRPEQFQFQPFTTRFCNKRLMPWGYDYSGSSNLDELNRLLSAFMIRRLKKNVLKQLPAKRRQLVPLDVAPKQMKRVTELKEQLKSIDINQVIQEGDNQTRNEQRQLLVQLYSESGLAKAKAATEFIVEKAESVPKLLVFGHHLEVLDQVEQGLKQKKIKFVRMDGRTSSKERFERVQAFQNDASVQIALLGITSCGQGITLTAASMVIFVEMHWTPGVVLQAEDRAHRIGQQHDSIQCLFLQLKGSVDDLIWPMIKRKLNTVGRALDGVEQTDFHSNTGEDKNDQGPINTITNYLVKTDPNQQTQSSSSTSSSSSSSLLSQQRSASKVHMDLEAVMPGKSQAVDQSTFKVIPFRDFTKKSANGIHKYLVKPSNSEKTPKKDKTPKKTPVASPTKKNTSDLSKFLIKVDHDFDDDVDIDPNLDLEIPSKKRTSLSSTSTVNQLEPQQADKKAKVVIEID